MSCSDALYSLDLPFHAQRRRRGATTQDKHYQGNEDGDIQTGILLRETSSPIVTSTDRCFKIASVIVIGMLVPSNDPDILQ